MRRSGFSLVELSIVLVILGLLVGGVLAGKSLIRAAELRSVVVASDRYRVALSSFRDKYFALAGDMPNAFSFWPICAASAALCNGNGDGTFPPYGSQQEELMAWRHLALAGLIEGSYTGSGTADALVIGTNVPASKLSPAGFYFTRITLNDGVEKERIGFGALNSSTDVYLVGNVLNAVESYNIDIKTDDGLPSSGRFQARDGFPNPAPPSCAGGNSYALTNGSTPGCLIYFTLN